MLSLVCRLKFKNLLSTVMCIPIKNPVNTKNLIVFNIKRRKKSVSYSQIQMNMFSNITLHMAFQVGNHSISISHMEKLASQGDEQLPREESSLCSTSCP